MIALAKKKNSSSHRNGKFEQMLPKIREHARVAFRGEPRERRDELIAEVVANAFVAYVRLIERGKENIIYVTPLVLYAIKHVRCGRRVGSRRNVNEVMSTYAQRARGITVESLHCFNQNKAEWKELLIEDRKAGPAEIAASRIDFGTWLKTLTNRQRHIAEILTAGETTTAVAKKFNVTLGRISQIRRELKDAWDAFHGEQTEETALAGDNTQ